MLLIAAVVFGPTFVLADGWIEVSDHSRRTIQPAPGPDRFRPRPAMSVIRHAVEIVVDGPLTTVAVDETFHNPYSHQLEGTYYFPLPQGAHIEDFRVTLGDKELVGEVMASERARKIYQDLVRQAIDPAILEYFQRDLFRARVFPIPAKGEVRLKITYRQILRREGGMMRLRYPLDTGRFSAGAYKNVSIHARVETDEPLKRIDSPSHLVETRRLGPRTAEVHFESRELPAQKDFILDLLTATDTLAGGVRTYRSPGEDGFSLIRLSPGQGLPDERSPVDLIFVVDTSGSMAGEKLVHAKRAMIASLDRLRPDDHFTILTFNGGLRVLSEETQRATTNNVAAARAFVQSLRARGGTDINSALERGLQLAHRRPGGAVVVLVSDGAPTVGVTDPRLIVKGSIERNRGDHRVHIFGVGQDVKTILLDEVARRNGGSRTYLADSKRLEVEISRLLDKVLFPCLSDIRISADGVSLDRFEPEGPYDLFFGEDLVVTSRYRGQGHARVEVSGTMAGEPRVFVFSVRFAKSGGSEEAAFLWAENRLDTLLEVLRVTKQRDRSAIQKEIVALGLRFGIVTPFTASLVKESDGAVANAFRGQVRRSPGALRRAKSTESGFFERDRADAFDYSRKLAEKKKAARSRGRSLALEAQPMSDAAELANTLRIRHAGGRGFIPIDGVYVDGGLQPTVSLPKPSRVIDYASAEYFELLARHPDVAPILSVGRSLLFEFEGAVIQIRDVGYTEPGEGRLSPAGKRWF